MLLTPEVTALNTPQDTNPFIFLLRQHRGLEMTEKVFLVEDN